MRDAQDAFKFLFTGDHEVILHAALKKLHLSPLHADYDDYLQESRLLFLKVYQRFPDDPLEKPHQFLAYAQQKIYWTILDRLRKERRQNQYRADGDHAALLAELPNTGDLQRDLEVRLYQARLLRLIREEGTLGEWTYLNGTLVNHLTAAEIARRCQVSRQTVLRWRKTLVNRLRRQNFWPDWN
ncbi:sigma-70 family RNA polymerase sigma factor [Levilactobacillus zymae]|uniref:sigma-70 family RNA polymerase sigma factor n=1 Tax=Levilactobacillus zymae TaxID=267363 RepID=UPI0028B41022|nr:sigma-70 family RNA polymerase sigma factor [Levilactobacillus zymae]MDT6981396.1 sigma-70 family RNA polymerase sigma factor [Levilactobacillus zymae]